MFDFNESGPQKSFDIIPDGTIATVRLTIRTGGAGEGGWLKRSKDGNSEALDCEFVVLDGPCAKRKFWNLFTLAGTTDGHREAGDISGRKLRAILESGRGVKPDDKSDAAKQARQISSYGDLDGLAFIARIGVEPAKNGYKAKNTLDRVITPDETAWHPVTQPPRPATTPPNAQPALASAIAKPKWAS
jgi:hypothetical protein